MEELLLRALELLEEAAREMDDSFYEDVHFLKEDYSLLREEMDRLGV